MTPVKNIQWGSMLTIAGGVVLGLLAAGLLARMLA